MTGIKFIRPGPWALGLTVAALIVLIGLGSWQVQRLQWKSDLIATIDRQMAERPASLPARVRTPEDWIYRPVSATGRFIHEKERHLFTVSPDGGPGYQIITPLIRADGGPTILVNRGWVPPERKNPQTRLMAQVTGTVTVTGLARESRHPGWFTPDDRLDGTVWYAANIEKMAGDMEIAPVAPLFIEADATPNPGGYPIGGQTRIDIPNDHLQYAITWYGLALVLLGVFAAYHVRKMPDLP